MLLSHHIRSMRTLLRSLDCRRRGFIHLNSLQNVISYGWRDKFPTTVRQYVQELHTPLTRASQGASENHKRATIVGDHAERQALAKAAKYAHTPAMCYARCSPGDKYALVCRARRVQPSGCPHTPRPMRHSDEHYGQG